MKSISLLLICLIGSCANASSVLPPANATLEYSCIGARKPCILQNVVLESETDLDRVAFPEITDPLKIESGRIPHFSRALAEKMSGIFDLTISHLQLKTMYVTPEIIHLDATDNQIETLLVDQSKDYEMRTLNLTGNRLSGVESLSKFTKLVELTLDGNMLQNVSMDVFAGMSELRILSLANNELSDVNTDNSLQLVKLRSLSFAGNQLYELNVEKWELDSLKELDLSSNQLYLLDGSLGQFKALADIKISNNQWKCEFLKELNQMGSLKFDHDKSGRCKELGLSSVKQVCCMCDSSNILDNTGKDHLEVFEEKWEELRQLNETFQQFKNATELNQLRIGQVEEEDNTTLVERIKQIDNKQTMIWSKINVQEESVVMNEMSQLKKIIENLESKHADLGSQLETLGYNYSSLRTEMSNVADKAMDRVTALENKGKGDEEDLIEKRIKILEGQQLKYHLLCVDLKSQIRAERSRTTLLREEIGKLRNQMDIAQENYQNILSILREIQDDQS